MSEESTGGEPPQKTLAWLSWHAERLIDQLDLTPEERAFAIDKGGKIVDFAVRGFWRKHNQHGVRHVATAAACAYALAWLQRWAEECEQDQTGGV